MLVQELMTGVSAQLHALPPVINKCKRTYCSKFKYKSKREKYQAVAVVGVDGDRKNVNHQTGDHQSQIPVFFCYGFLN